jgi:hypothetical protein
VLGTLTEEFPGFKAAVNEYIFEVARKEAAGMPGQVLPSSLTMADIENFDYVNFYNELQFGAPALHSAVRGTMAGPGHYDFNEVTIRVVGDDNDNDDNDDSDDGAI